MRSLFFFVLNSIVFACNAAAAGMSCDAQATAHKLDGALRSSFVQKCEMTEKSAATSCEGLAASKKLAGAAKNSYIRKCYEGSRVPVPVDVFCETTADEKKLSGAARSKSVKKCVTDAKKSKVEEKPRAGAKAEKKNR